MREPITSEVLHAFMRSLAAEAREPGRIYLTGGASAVLHHWRASTVDVDIRIVPENDRILRAIPNLKETLQINVELASPLDFLPPLPGWEERSPFITREGPLSFHHFDFYSQALSKLERGHRKDLADVQMMISSGFVEPRRLQGLFAEIEPQLYRFPAVDPRALRASVNQI
jgi:hypothetical protein